MSVCKELQGKQQCVLNWDFRGEFQSVYYQDVLTKFKISRDKNSYYNSYSYLMLICDCPYKQKAKIRKKGLKILAEIKEHERQEGKKRKVQQAENHIIGTSDAKLKESASKYERSHLYFILRDEIWECITANSPFCDVPSKTTCLSQTDIRMGVKDSTWISKRIK